VKPAKKKTPNMMK